MKHELTFGMTRPARKKGGDRYEATLQDGEVMVIYVPQIISRPEGRLLQVIKVTFEEAK